MTVRDYLVIFEEKAPLSLASEWDNSGLQCGRLDLEVSGVFVALDPDDVTVDEAIKAGCNLILTHHPLILFDTLKNVTESTRCGRRIIRMIENKMALYSMHTTYDKAICGMADAAAKLLGLIHTEPMLEASCDGSGIGRIGSLPEEMSILELANKCKEVFELNNIAVYSREPGKIISRVAVLPGSGKSEWELAMDMGAECYITGDMTYHAALDAVNDGFAVIDATHSGIEKLFVKEMTAYLAEIGQSDSIDGCRVKVAHRQPEDPAQYL